MKTIVIATRGSRLALWQAHHIKDRLEARYADMRVELSVIKTKGDIILDVPLAKVGGKGLFVKEIEEALLNNSADIAVHSMKDVPMELPAGLVLGCIPERETPSDSFLSVNFANITALPQGSHVGTSSLRRQAQLLALRPDLRISSLRGNVDTRLRKLIEGQYDAIILATSGLKRLDLTAPVMDIMGPPAFMPAVGQGALGIECRSDRQDLLDMLAFMDHPATRICVEAERGFLAGLQGGCQVPIAGHAIMRDETNFTLEGLVAHIDGSKVLRQRINGKADTARQSGLDLAQSMLNTGAQRILNAVYAALEQE